MPKNNNDAYLLNFVGKFFESYTAAKERDKDRDYKSTLAKAELDAKTKKEADDKAQQDFENSLRLNSAQVDADKYSRETQFIDEKGVVHKTMPLTPEQVKAAQDRIRGAATARGYGSMFEQPAAGGQPSLPPLPVPAAATAGIPPMIARPSPPQPPPLPGQGPLPSPTASLPMPPAPPANIKKFPTFPDDNLDSLRADAEARRYQKSIGDEYERESKPFKETVTAYSDARQSYARAQLAASRGESSSVADKDMVLAMISARQGSRISDADFRLAMEQGSVDERALNFYGMAVQGRMTPAIRNQIMKLTRDAVISRNKEFTENVEKHYINKVKTLVPGLDPSVVIRNLRPVDFEQMQADYDAEYNAPKAGATYSDPEKERRYQEWKAKNAK